MPKLAVLFCFVLFGVSAVRSQSHNGKEFWLGYGEQQMMISGTCSFSGDNSQDMILYVTTDSLAATLTVTIDSSGLVPSLNWSRTYNIPAYTSISTQTYPATSYTGSAGNYGGLPKGSNGSYDCRLVDEGLLRKIGVHVVSNVDVTIQAQIYGNVSSGVTLLAPVDSWGTSYISVNSQQIDAAAPSHSWVFMVASENNTRVEVIPSIKTKFGKLPGVPFTVDLQKGQIYNLLSQSDCTGAGGDFAGTKITSIAGSDGVIHRIGAFSGSSRTRGEILCGTGSGRDNDVQQLLPISSWGQRFLTAPASSSSNGVLAPQSFQAHVYKVFVTDPATIVKRNGIALAGLNSQGYYIFTSNTADYIEADEPICIGQFFSGSSSCDPGSDGDPDFVCLTPLEQGTNTSCFSRINKQVIYSNYLTLVVPTAAVSSLRIDNSSLFNYVYPHPNLPGYSVVVKGWAAGESRCQVACDSAFTGTSYGLGATESYLCTVGQHIDSLQIGFIWRGNSSSSWNDFSNWSGRNVPGAADNVVVPAGAPHPLNIPDGVTVYCRSLTVKPGAQVIVGQNANVVIAQ